MASQLFRTKPLSLLLEEMKGENRLRRILGPVQLTALGVGAIIGTGIFILTGIAAHDRTGPALMLSFVLAGLACVFAALCYAEFASMVPVAGSAYTYAYATLGELFAWIICWDLVLEYAVASSTVAHGWSHYFLSFLNIFGVTIPERWTKTPIDIDQMTHLWTATGAYCNLPAALVVLFITVVLVIGIRESAGFNAAMVVLKVIVVLLVIGLGAGYVRPQNWRPFLPFGWQGVMQGASYVFFAYIGFDSVSTHAADARNPKRDVPIGLITSLALCTALHISVAAVLPAMFPYPQVD